MKHASRPFSRSIASNSRHMRSRRLSNQSRAACCSPSRVIMPDKVPSAVMLHSTRCPLRRQYSRSENPPTSECESEAQLDHAHRREHLPQSGRETCRERVCTYVENEGVAGLQKKK